METIQGKELQVVALGGNFFQPNYFMVSADPHKSDIWKKVTGKSGRIWLYQPEGSRVWVDGGKGSQGCGGRTLTFTLDDGTTQDLIGPWCSNSDACFADTGIDVRKNHVTWGCVGTERLFDQNSGRSGIGNIIWRDEEPTKGLFERVELIAWKLQQENPDLTLQVYRESEGGSSLGPVSEPMILRRARKDPSMTILDELLNI